MAHMTESFQKHGIARWWMALVVMAALTAGCGSTPLLPDPAVRYLAFGDSTTAGAADVQYWQYVQQDLGLSTAAFAGQGHGGETVADGLLRLKDLLDRNMFPNAEAMLLWEGGDDILRFVNEHDPLLLQVPTDPNYMFQSDLNALLDQVQMDLASAIGLARQKGLYVYIATYYDLVPGDCKASLLTILLPEQATRANQYVRLLNERIGLAASGQGATLVDIASQSSTLTSDPANYANCNHLSGQGNRIAANVWLARIQQQ